MSEGSDRGDHVPMVKPEDVAAAAALVREADAALRPLRTRWVELQNTRLRLERTIAKNQERADRYATLTRWLVPWAWCTIAAALGWGIVTLALVLGDVSVAIAAGVGVAAAVAAGIGTALWFWAARQADARIAQAEAELAQILPAIDALEPHYREAERRFQELEGKLRQLQYAYTSELNQLLTAPWRRLSGREFEQFIARVLRFHGYDVELTTISSDQGADLLVRAPNGRKIAVEVKGYPSGTTVGNDVVLKAVGGARYWGCDRAAVITNSRFTRSADEAARQTNTLLIDGTQIPDLISGRIRL